MEPDGYRDGLKYKEALAKQQEVLYKT